MEQRRRSERLVALLRWFVLMLGLAAAGDELPTLQLAVVLGIVAAYNGALMYYIADSVRFLHFGRKLSLMARVMDIAVITFVIAASGTHGSSVYLLYWFVLVSCGYATASIHKLVVFAAASIIANSAATFYAVGPAGIEEVIGLIVVRGGVIVFGFLVAAYIAKTRSQDELASTRGSYLHAILNCGARLTGFRSVHELALYVLESAVTQTNASGGELLLVNDETQELACEAFWSTSGPSRESNMPAEPLLRSYANWVLSTGREFMVRTGGKTGEEANVDKDEHPAMAAPLLWQTSGSDGDNSVLGVLIVWGFPDEDFGQDALDIVRIFAAIAGAAIVNLRLYTNLQKSFLRTLQSLANGLEARDEYTQGHSERVMHVACLIAEELGVPSENVDLLRNASLLHDIGKIGVPDAILRKAGKLTADEWETMRRHPIVSEEICRPLGLASEILFLIRHHHERLDAKGYPAGLPSQEQPLLQRILVVADSFDAMRSRRPYRDSMPREELLSEFNKNAGRTLDPTVVNALMRLMNNGSLDAVYEEHDRLIDGTVRSMKAAKRAA